MTAAAKHITIAEALQSKHLFGPYFDGDSWRTWIATAKAIFGEPLTASELVLFKEVAGDRDPPTYRVKEFVAAIGRGGGKNSIASAIAAFIAMSFDPRAAKLRPGEKVWVICIANDKEQAALAHSMIAALFETIPVLQALVKGKIGTESIELKNKVIIEVKTNSYRSVRGRGILACILDEVGFYRDDSQRYANPDIELVAAVSPGLARVPNSMLVLISSVYRRSGVLFDYWHDCHGKADEDILVVKGTTRQFNPSFDQKKIDKAIVKERGIQQHMAR
jgi:phage terminase large subunit-like protein